MPDGLPALAFPQRTEGEQMELKGLAALEFLNLHAQALEELRQRGLIRSSNNPVGDYAEYFFCRAFEWFRDPEISFQGRGQPCWQILAQNVRRPLAAAAI
jgi:hypothetical protein